VRDAPVVSPPPKRGLPNRRGFGGACTTRTLFQSSSISSANTIGIAVIVPWPISEAGE
jgi:hypothetical protein